MSNVRQLVPLTTLLAIAALFTPAIATAEKCGNWIVLEYEADVSELAERQRQALDALVKGFRPPIVIDFVLITERSEFDTRATSQVATSPRTIAIQQHLARQFPELAGKLHFRAQPLDSPTGSLDVELLCHVPRAPGIVGS